MNNTNNRTGDHRRIALNRQGALDGGKSFNLVHGLALICLLLFVYFSFSRILDFYFGSLRLPMITSVFALLGMVLSGGVPRVLSSRMAQFLFGFTIWLIVCIPFSIWKGGSFFAVKEAWGKSLLIAVTALGLIRTVEDVRKIAYAIGLGSITSTLLTLAFHTTVEEWRWALPVGYLGNPNDLAQLLLSGIPFLGLMVLLPNTTWLSKACGAAGLLGSLCVIGATGSRGAVIAAVIIGFIVFCRGSSAVKLKFIVGAFLAAAVVAMVVPNAVISRLKTVTGGSLPERSGSLQSAVESRSNRLRLLKQSLYLTLQHPVFGVGPGQFQVASHRLSKGAGEMSSWRETHNTFTQVSSETGLPGFFLYMGVIVVCVRGVSAINRRYRGRPEYFEVYAISFALYLSLISFLVTCFFSSMAYHFYLPLLAAICAGFVEAVKAEEAKREVPVPRETRPPEMPPAPRQRKPRQLHYFA